MAVRNISVVSNCSQRATIVIQQIRMYLRYDVRTHTDTACVQHVNVGLAQVRPNNPSRAMFRRAASG